MTGENMYMNVVPAGNGNEGGMFGGNGGWMWFLLVWMAMFGWGNGGLGNWGGNAGNSLGNEVQRGFDQNAIMTGLGGVRDVVAGIVPAIQNSFAQAEIAANARQMADMQQNFGIQTALQQCCCDNKSATMDLKYTVANEAAATRSANQAGYQGIMDKLCQMEMDGIKQNYEGQIRAMQNQLDAARTEIQNLKTAASIGGQTAQIMAHNEAQTVALERYLAPTPVPAYVVQNPNCCSQWGSCANAA